MMGRLTLVLAVVASIGVTGTHACDMEAMMACVQPITGMGGGSPTTEQIQQLCSAMRNLQPCMDAAGCAANMVHLEDMVQQSIRLCQSNAAVTVACDMDAMVACVQPLIGGGMTGGNGPTSEQIHQMCSAMRNLPPCMEAAGCAAHMDQYSAMVAQSIDMCESHAAVTVACDTDALMACVQPFSDGSMIGGSGPTMEQIHQMCSAMRNLPSCLEAAGCASHMDQYSAMLTQSLEMCDALRPEENGQGAQGSSCDAMAGAQCMMNLAGSSPGSTAEMCSALSALDECLSGVHCTLEQLLQLSGQGEAMLRPIQDARELCSAEGV